MSDPFDVEVKICSDLGFTGTREGMTHRQLQTVRELVQEIDPLRVHHGDCWGADSDFHLLLTQEFSHLWIVVHPPINPKHRAYCQANQILEPKEYLARNRAIVHASELLVAVPEGQEDRYPRSGTWYTVRYARTLTRPIKIVNPDGSISEECC